MADRYAVVADDTARGQAVRSGNAGGRDRINVRCDHTSGTDTWQSAERLAQSANLARHLAVRGAHQNQAEARVPYANAVAFKK